MSIVRHLLLMCILLLLSYNIVGQKFDLQKVSTSQLLKDLKNLPPDSTSFPIYAELTIRYFEHHLDSAYMFGHLALSEAVKNNEKPQISRISEYLGRIHKNKSQIDSALFYLNQAQSTSDKPIIWMSSYLQISSIHQLSGHYDAALQSLLAIDSIAKITNNLDFQGKSMASIGELWRVRGQVQQALDYLKEAAVIFQQVDNKNNYLWVMGRIATCYRGLGNYEAGIQTIKTILSEKNRPFLSKNNLALNHNAMGNLYTDTGQFVEAEYHFQQSIRYAKEVGRDYFIQSGLNTLIDIYTKQGYHDKAIKTGIEALALCKDGTDYRNLRNIHLNLSKVYEQSDSATQSLYHLKEYLRFKDSLSNQERLKITETLEERYKSDLQSQKIIAKEQDLKLAASQRNMAILLGLFTILLILLYFRQRSVQKQKEATLLVERTQELERLDDLKSRFFANISHELRTPLTLIWAPLNAILNQKMGEVHPSLNYPLHIIKNNCQRLLELVEEILDLSKLDARKMEAHFTEIPLQSFIQRLTFAFQSATEIKRIDFKINNLLSENLIIRSDKRKLEKIFNNLISNALKFTPEQGEIIFIADTKDNGDLQFKVKDSGRGIHPDDLAHVFDRYFQSSQKNTPIEGGTGIGLALSKEFADLLEGTLTVKSELGSGSLFTLTLPQSVIIDGSKELDKSAESEISTEQASPISYISGIPSPVVVPVPPIPSGDSTTQGRIMIVEDNPEMQAFLQSVIGTDYQIILANNGKMALTLLEQQEQVIDLILSDVMMPEMDGFTLLKHLKADEHLLQIPVIMLTARADMRDKLFALNAGVDDYMTKPFEAEELIVRIKNLIDHQIQRKEVIQRDKSIPTPKVRKPDLDWLKRVEEILKREVSNSNYTLMSLAEELSISKSQLHRKIKWLTGLTPNKYFREIKLTIAKELLEDRTYETMAEVSYAIGFDDPQYFSKIYFQRFGKRPSAYL